MVKLNPFQFLIDALSNLTGGLIADLQTLLLGVLVCSFIVMALGYLMDAMEGAMNARLAGRYSSEAAKALDDRNQFASGSFEYQKANLKYRKLLNKAVNQELNNSDL
ncbi:MAG: hypothetical protein PHI97_21930 [Desulfobulbus sp.]|nr:hypothetical protein [Desulfobulbus sp.]